MISNRQYFLCYDTPLSFDPKFTHLRRKGRQLTDKYDGLKFMLEVASKLCGIYGEGTHWIEDEDGSVVTLDDI